MKLRERYEELGARKFARWYLLKRIGKPVVRKIDAFMASQSTIGDPVIFDNELLPWVTGLEAHWKEIRAELDAVLERREAIPPVQEIQPDQYKISPDDKWRAYFFYGFGHPSERNLAECPTTARALETVPGVVSAFFSILAPGKHVPPHVGITKGLARLHLGLKVPKDREKCVMHVADHQFCWEEGRAVVFDDTRKHQVWNDTEEERAVLIIDFVRPMRPAGRAAWWLTRSLFSVSPFVRDARRNQRAWEERSDAAAPDLEASLR